MAQFTKRIQEITVTDYCKQYNITRHAVHRRIKKYNTTKKKVNNIIDVKKFGEKIIILVIDTSIVFKKK